MNKEQQIVEFQNDIIDNLFDGGTYKLAESLYNAGYRKTFTSDFASDTQKAFKEGYIKGSIDRMNECNNTKDEVRKETARESLNLLLDESEYKRLYELKDKIAKGELVSKAEYEKPIDKFIKDREKQAVKEFAGKVKKHAEQCYDWSIAKIVCAEVENVLLKEYEK